MYPYKVFYLDSTLLKKTSGKLYKGHMDGLATSKNLEALIIEQSENGYELVSSDPIDGTIHAAGMGIRTVVGFMVTFKKTG